MRTRRLLLATIIAVTIAVKLATSYCFPLCPLYDPWDAAYWIFSCDSCAPNPPEGG